MPLSCPLTYMYRYSQKYFSSWAFFIPDQELWTMTSTFKLDLVQDQCEPACNTCAMSSANIAHHHLHHYCHKVIIINISSSKLYITNQWLPCHECLDSVHVDPIGWHPALLHCFSSFQQSTANAHIKLFNFVHNSHVLLIISSLLFFRHSTHHTWELSDVQQ